MTFERTYDMEPVKQLLTDPRCYARMKNDAAPPLEYFAIKEGDDYVAILAMEDSNHLGVFLLVPKSPGSAEVHFCFSPTVWGNTLVIAKGFMEWIWAHTRLERLLGPVPSYNHLALELAESAGFRQYELVVGVGMKNGRSFDLILTEALRPAEVSPE